MEREVRITMEEPGYRKVVEHFESSIIEIQYQWNIFFDTPNLDLNKSRRIIRLRSLKTVVINPSLSQFAHRQHKHHHKEKKDRKEKKEKKEKRERKEKRSKKEDNIDSNDTEVSESMQTSESMTLPVSLSTGQLGTIPYVKTEWFLTLKRPGVIKDGVATRPEKEAEITPELAQELIAHPSQIIDNAPKKIKKYLKDCADWKNFEIIGDFLTYRRLLAYENLVIEADETIFPNLTNIFELEIETDDTQTAKQKIEQKMRELHISFVNSNSVKLARLMKLSPQSRCSRTFSKQ